MAENEALVPTITARYPVMKLDNVVLPGETISVKLTEEGPAFINAFDASDKKVFVTSQKPEQGEVGTLAIVTGLTSLSDGCMGAVLEGQSRRRSSVFYKEGDVDFARVEPAEMPLIVDNVLVKQALNGFKECFPDNKKMTEIFSDLAEVAAHKPAALADRMAQHLQYSLGKSEKEKLLKTFNPNERLEHVCDLLVKEKKRAPADKADDENDFDALAREIADAGMTEQARVKCEKELRKLRKMNSGDSNASKVQEYLEKMVSLPWKESSKLVEDLHLAEVVLGEDHYGLKKVQERIIEQLAVQKRTGNVNGAIICLVGPPGVGKTSIGKSIAKATGRKFVRVSLGGVSDEAEIRGHRTTYVGALPGKIMNAMDEAGTVNPVMQLDEIDKMTNKHGDPAAALLEVLDPAQNNAFVDHYTDVKYDLSNVMFIATANDVDNIPGPLYDRMEIIHIEGYTDDEKMEIAKRYLVKKEMEKSGLTEAQFSINDQALAKLVDGYTCEAGVRGLEHEIGNLARKTVRQLELGTVTSVNITPENLEAYAGPVKISHEMVDPTPRVGHMNGLGVRGGTTGVILTVQAISYADSKGGIEATGNLSETMGEAIKNADAFVKANAAELGINKKEYLNNTIHIKIGRGGVNSDGPSAGLAIGAVITSVRTGIPIRGDIAMTGEINLLGEAWAIGGLAKKFDGAFKSGIKTVLFPAANMKDLEDADFPQALKDKLEIMPDARAEDLAEVPEGKMRVIAVANEMEVLRHALVRMPGKKLADQFNNAGADKTSRKKAIKLVKKNVAQTAFEGAVNTPANDVGLQEAKTGVLAVAESKESKGKHKKNKHKAALSRQD